MRSFDEEDIGQHERIVHFIISLKIYRYNMYYGVEKGS